MYVLRFLVNYNSMIHINLKATELCLCQIS